MLLTRFKRLRDVFVVVGKRFGVLFQELLEKLELNAFNLVLETYFEVAKSFLVQVQAKWFVSSDLLAFGRNASPRDRM